MLFGIYVGQLDEMGLVFGLVALAGGGFAGMFLPLFGLGVFREIPYLDGGI